jgi:hypothetical protein
MKTITINRGTLLPLLSLMFAALATISLALFTGCSDRTSHEHGAKGGSVIKGETMNHSTVQHDHGTDVMEHSTQTHSTRMEFSAEPSAIPAGKPATWRLKIVESESGEPVQEFESVHEKLLHLIVVSTDLTWFNHLHPEYQGNGLFTIEAILPRAGSYKLYADYTPKGKTQEVAQHEFKTDGGLPTPAPFVPLHDTAGAGGWMRHQATARPEGEPEAEGGDVYQVALMPMPMKLTSNTDVMLHFQMRDASGNPVNDLEPYLGALGHAVILSSDTKVYLHTHPMEGGMEGMDHGAMEHGKMDHGMMVHSHPTSGGPDVIFHTNFPSAGFYKVWGQFQHRGKIITAPFVLKVEAGSNGDM